MFQFSCRFAFLSTFRLSNRTPKITRILTLHQANAPVSKLVRFWDTVYKTTEEQLLQRKNLHTIKRKRWKH